MGKPYFNTEFYTTVTFWRPLVSPIESCSRTELIIPLIPVSNSYIPQQVLVCRSSSVVYGQFLFRKLFADWEVGNILRFMLTYPSSHVITILKLPPLHHDHRIRLFFGKCTTWCECVHRRYIISLLIYHRMLTEREIPFYLLIIRFRAIQHTSQHLSLALSFAHIYHSSRPEFIYWYGYIIVNRLHDLTWWVCKIFFFIHV